MRKCTRGTKRLVPPAIILAFAALLAMKLPHVMEGRLWAEDGYFLIDALRLSAVDALTTQHTGYIDIVASGIMVTATHIASLEGVPLVSVSPAVSGTPD